MINKKIKLMWGILLVGVLVGVVGLVSATAFGNPTPSYGGFSGSYQYQSPSFNSYYSSGSGGAVAGMGDFWPTLNDIENDQCEATSDFIVSIPPLGCTPMVVRSDLLADQNVPVFCKLDSLQINPLIKVSSIKSISFKGDYPRDMIAGISFHPARAAVRSYNTLLGNPLVNNIGYVVIILKRNPVEADLPEWVAGNLTATIRYDADEAYGTGQGEYYVPVVSDTDWKLEHDSYSFWNGRGYLRVLGIGEGVVRVGLYTGGGEYKFRELTLKEGETSSLIYFPGFYCKAGLKVKVNKLVAPEKQALLKVDGSDIWVRKGSKVMEGRCTVREINVIGDTGNVEVNCPGKKLNLVLSKFAAEISVNGGVAKSYAIGDKIEGTKKMYVLYSGELPEGVFVEGTSEKDFIIVAALNREPTEKDKAGLYSLVSEKLGKKDMDYDEFESSLKSLKDYGALTILGVGTSAGNTAGETVVFNGLTSNANSENIDYGISAEAEEHYDNLEGTVTDLVDVFPSEAMASGEPYGEAALFEQIEAAKTLKMYKIRGELITKFLERYPGSAIVDKMKTDLRNLGIYDYTNAGEIIYVNNEYHSISLEQVKDVDAEEKKVTLYMGGKEYNRVEGGNIEYNGDKFFIEEVAPTSVKLVYTDTVDNVDKKNKEKKTTRTIKLDDSYYFGEEGKGVEVLVKDIDVDAVAHISLIPEVKYTQTDANFTFRLGIEKRAIELTPEKAKSMIENLNDTIESWSEANDKLGKLIKGWKGACFATSTLLMVKNMADGTSGKALARTKVMERYRAICASDKYKSMTRTQCYNELEDEINAAVDDYTEVLQKTNKDMDVSVDKFKTGGLLDSSIIDQKKLVEDMASGFGDEKIVFGENGEFKPEKTKDSDITFGKDDVKTTSQVRAWLTWKNAKGKSEEVENIAKKELEDSWSGALINKKANAAAALTKKSNAGLPISSVTDTRRDKEKREFYWTGDVTDKDYTFEGVKIASGTKIQEITHYKDHKNYVLTFKNQGKSMVVDKIFRKGDGGKLFLVSGDEKVMEFDVYKIRSGGDCSYSYKDPVARYYEAGGNKGWPAIVPFNTVEGWYVYVPPSAGTFLEGVQGYKASGDVSYFRVCNVGKNHLEEMGGGDDLCQSFDVNTYASIDDFIPCPSLSGNKVQELATRARAAIREAQRQYGQSTIRIPGVDEEIKTGAPVTDTGDVDCQDFMSPQDCKMLFNVCDPVICPASRCDLGGKMKVADVVQTGIIGSIALCLPNAKEGILIPVCLTGIHAGIDSLISIMESERDCLQHSIETGEHVGICDEITSVYKCEFFWKQVAPFMNLLIPKLIESAYGGSQGARGGGEYLTVTHSWDNLQKSVDFFKNSYAQNAFRAFQYRNVEEAGSEFCRAFVGTSFPSSAEALDSLLEPESPTQFYAWFHENAFTEATVPATSHYKVYYHIYAGNDRSASYQVYLKSPPASGYYRINPTVLVKTGFIAKGESGDEAIDFNAPEGYKELCVRINEQEECGFKQVTSNFGLDYVQKKYVEEQAENQDITSEKACISGTPSGWPLVNPNIQAGVEEAARPQIALRGIVRICATANPGEGVGGTDRTKCQNDAECQREFANNAKCKPDGNCEYKLDEDGDAERTGSQGVQIKTRWKDVGYCDDSNTRCWLDTDSVEGDLKDIAAIENKTISGLLDDSQRMTDEVRKLEKDVAEDLSKLRVKVNGFKSEGGDGIDIITKLNAIIGYGDNVAQGNNNQQAEAYYLKARVYAILIDRLKNGVVVKPGPKKVAEGNEGDENEEEQENIEEIHVTEDTLLENIEVGDILIDNEGEKWTVEISQEYEVNWRIFLKNDDGAQRSISGSPDEEISEWDYTLKL